LWRDGDQGHEHESRLTTTHATLRTEGQGLEGLGQEFGSLGTSTESGDHLKRRILILISLVGAALAITACTAQTDAATNISSTSATFNGHGPCGVGYSYDAWFQYRAKGTSTWTDTVHTGSTLCSSSATITKSLNVTGLASNTPYQYRIAATQTSNPGQIVYSDSNGNTSNDGSDSNGVVYTGFTTAAASSPWPSTYTNGPLGSNELLPATKGHTLLALWSGVAGYTSSQQRAFVQQRITDIGHAPDFIGFACDGSCSAGSAQLDVSGTDLSENWIHSKGAVPIVANYDPGSSTDFAGIAAGHYDSNIDAAASRLKNFGHRIMVRMFQEFEEHGSWSATDFVNAWGHVVSRFKSDGATNVGFWWCPGEQADGNGLRSQINASYPGDTYVDWVGSDGYNRDSGYSTPLHSGWAEFSELFNYSVSGHPSTEQQYGPTKPFFVGETGTKYDTPKVPSGHTVDVNRKKNWFVNISTAAPQMPYLIGVDPFDQDVHTLEAGNNWRVDSPCDSAGNHCNDGSTDSNTYSEFLSMAGSSQFSGGVAGGVNP
jgi:beta-mannanase